MPDVCRDRACKRFVAMAIHFLMRGKPVNAFDKTGRRHCCQRLTGALMDRGQTQCFRRRKKAGLTQGTVSDLTHEWIMGRAVRYSNTTGVYKLSASSKNKNSSTGEASRPKMPGIPRQCWSLPAAHGLAPLAASIVTPRNSASDTSPSAVPWVTWISGLQPSTSAAVTRISRSGTRRSRAAARRAKPLRSMILSRPYDGC